MHVLWSTQTENDKTSGIGLCEKCVSVAGRCRQHNAFKCSWIAGSFSVFSILILSLTSVLRQNRMGFGSKSSAAMWQIALSNELPVCETTEFMSNAVHDYIGDKCVKGLEHFAICFAIRFSALRDRRVRPRHNSLSKYFYRNFNWIVDRSIASERLPIATCNLLKLLDVRCETKTKFMSVRCTALDVFYRFHFSVSFSCRTEGRLGK